MRQLLPCSRCEELVPEGVCICPHCGERRPCASKTLPRAALLLGITVGLTACTGSSKDYSGVIFDEADEALASESQDEVDASEANEAAVVDGKSQPSVQAEDAAEVPNDAKGPQSGAARGE